MEVIEFIGPVVYLIFILLVTIPLTAPLAVWWSAWTEVRKRRRQAADSDAASGSHTLPVRFELRHLAHWMPLLLIALAVVAAVGFIYGWQAAIVPVAVSGYFAYRWQIVLRRQRVAWPIVYAIGLWILPQLVCTVMILLVTQDLDWFGDSYNATYNVPDWVWNVNRGQTIIWKTSLLVATACVAVVALAYAHVLTRSKRPAVSPNLVAAAAFAHAFVFWFSNPFGFLLGAWTMVWIGHAISREARAALFELGDTAEVASTGQNRQRVIRNVIAGLAIVTAIAAVAYGIYWMYAVYDESTRLEFDGIPIMLSWILGIALAPATIWFIYRDKLREYGAAICGLAWIPISYVVYGLYGARTYQEYWLHEWSYWQMAAVAVGASAMLVAMWRVFGPAAAAGDRRIHASEDSRTVVS